MFYENLNKIQLVQCESPIWYADVLYVNTVNSNGMFISEEYFLDMDIINIPYSTSYYPKEQKFRLSSTEMINEKYIYLNFCYNFWKCLNCQTILNSQTKTCSCSHSALIWQPYDAVVNGVIFKSDIYRYHFDESNEFYHLV